MADSIRIIKDPQNLVVSVGQSSITNLGSNPSSVIQNAPVNEVEVEETINQVVFTSPGPQGPQGPPGADGSSGVQQFDFIQVAPTTPWLINHPFTTGFPDVDVIIGGVAVTADITYSSSTLVTVDFASPQSGRAELYGT